MLWIYLLKICANKNISPNKINKYFFNYKMLSSNPPIPSYIPPPPPSTRLHLLSFPNVSVRSVLYFLYILFSTFLSSLLLSCHYIFLIPLFPSPLKHSFLSSSLSFPRLSSLSLSIPRLSSLFYLFSFRRFLIFSFPF